MFVILVGKTPFTNTLYPEVAQIIGVTEVIFESWARTGTGINTGVPDEVGVGVVQELLTIVVPPRVTAPVFAMSCPFTVVLAPVLTDVPAIT